jgi:hypothetical protein
MKLDKAYLVGTNKSSFRAGIPAEIIGVDMVSIEVHPTPRPNFHIRYSDGMEDHVPFIDSNNFEVITFTDIINGNIPKVVF